MSVATVAILTVQHRTLMATITGVATAAVVLVPHLLATFQWWSSHNARRARMCVCWRARCWAAAGGRAGRGWAQ